MIELSKENFSIIVDSEEKALIYESKGYVRSAAEKTAIKEYVKEEEKTAETDDLSGKTVKELRYIACEKGIELKSKKKADIIKEIQEWQK